MIRLAASTILFLLTTVALAQNAVVSGRIVDATEAAIPNASVTLLNRNTRVQANTSSNTEGYFVFPPQQPGLYDVSAVARGSPRHAWTPSRWR